VDYKREEFHLDFNSSAVFSSDKSTTDNFQSDEEAFKFKAFKKSLGASTKKKDEFEQQRARSSSEHKFYWYWP
jgi:replication initiation and membrane attachment protein DnaB